MGIQRHVIATCYVDLVVGICARGSSGVRLSRHRSNPRRPWPSTSADSATRRGFVAHLTSRIAAGCAAARCVGPPTDLIELAALEIAGHGQFPSASATIGRVDTKTRPFYWPTGYCSSNFQGRALASDVKRIGPIAKHLTGTILEKASDKRANDGYRGSGSRVRAAPTGNFWIGSL